MAELTVAQRSALEFVRAKAERDAEPARARIAALLDRDDRAASVGAAAGAAVGAALTRHARVALHFHPDRLLADRTSVVESLARDGRYRSQFETGISNGGLTAYPGGDRDRWERRMFGGAYQQPGAGPDERPKYGALDLFRHPDGPAPRFGSCYLRLAGDGLRRCTFSCGDSVLQPTATATADVLEPVLAGLLEAIAVDGWRLGRERLDPPGLIAMLSAPPSEQAADRPGRSLDEYVEAQVHGDVRLAGDVDLLVADPSFRGTPTGTALSELAERYGMPLRWHLGFELGVEEVPDGFRGPLMPPLARRLVREFGASRTDPRVDAALVGRGAASVQREPGRWADWGTPADSLQHLKQLWHCLVAHGHPRPADRP